MDRFIERFEPTINCFVILQRANIERRGFQCLAPAGCPLGGQVGGVEVAESEVVAGLVVGVVLER
jgi:hypothetical protein